MSMGIDKLVLRAEWRLLWLLIVSVKINSVLLNKANIKADSITYADKFIAKKQTSANILEYMINQVLF